MFASLPTKRHIFTVRGRRVWGGSGSGLWGEDKRFYFSTNMIVLLSSALPLPVASSCATTSGGWISALCFAAAFGTPPCAAILDVIVGALVDRNRQRSEQQVSFDGFDTASTFSAEAS